MYGEESQVFFFVHRVLCYNEQMYDEWEDNCQPSAHLTTWQHSMPMDEWEDNCQHPVHYSLSPCFIKQYMNINLNK